MPTFDKFVIQGSPFVRLAGLSGASAVALGAYGAHSKYTVHFVCVIFIEAYLYHIYQYS